MVFFYFAGIILQLDMKKLWILVPVITLLASCVNGNKPEKIATDFLTAVKEQKWDRAKELATSSYATEIKDAQDFFADSVFVKEIKDVSCTVSGDSAICTFCCTNAGNGSLTLVKDGKSWKVKGGLKFTFDELVADTASINEEVVLEITEDDHKADDLLDQLEEENASDIQEIENQAKKKKGKK